MEYKYVFLAIQIPRQFTTKASLFLKAIILPVDHSVVVHLLPTNSAPDLYSWLWYVPGDQIRSRRLWNKQLEQVF